MGTTLVRKKCLTSEMLFSLRRDLAALGANAASVPTLTSTGSTSGGADGDAVVARATARLAGTAFVRFALTAAAFAGVFGLRCVRARRSGNARTSLSRTLLDRPIPSLLH